MPRCTRRGVSWMCTPSQAPHVCGERGDGEQHRNAQECALHRAAAHCLSKWVHHDGRRSDDDILPGCDMHTAAWRSPSLQFWNITVRLKSSIDGAASTRTPSARRPGWLAALETSLLRIMPSATSHASLGRLSYLASVEALLICFVQTPHLPTSS
jgi:hypothetical protein